MTYKRTRLIYQTVFFFLFAFLLTSAARGAITSYPVKLFLNMSALSALSTMLSQHNIAGGMILGVVLLAATLFLGRFFCGWICPMGACQDAASFLFQDKDKKQCYLKHSFSRGQRIKYAVLIVFVIASVFGVQLAGYVDPLALVTRVFATVVSPFANLIFHHTQSQTVAFQMISLTAAIFIAAFILNILRPRFWCRMICPLGGLLGLFSLRPLFRIARDTDKCIRCGQCGQVCQGGCQPDKELIVSDCVMCMNCINICPTHAIEYKHVSVRMTPPVPTDTWQGMALTRRGFLATGLVALSTVAVLRNLKNVLGRGYPWRIRPPGSLPEPDFLARCVRCGHCMNVCPTNVLQPASTEVDLEGIWTPILNMSNGYCEYDCTQCSQICPTHAIQPITIADKHRLKYERIGTAFVDRGRCLPWAYGRECLVCQEVCPVSPKAIYFQKQRFTLNDGTETWMNVPYVIAEKCIGCGACEFNCPVQDKRAIYVTSIGESRSLDRKMIL